MKIVVIRKSILDEFIIVEYKNKVLCFDSMDGFKMSEIYKNLKTDIFEIEIEIVNESGIL